MVSPGNKPSTTLHEGQHKFLVADDGHPLLYRTWLGNSSKPTIFLGHTQPTHSGHYADLAFALNKRGWTAHSGDLRGHGQSVRKGSRLAHLNRESGWAELVGDMNTLLQAAFEGVAFEHRVVATQNISALLTLELLKTNPNLAGHIILTPPAYQRELAVMTQAFVTSRMELHAADVPDPQALHHFYKTWGAMLQNPLHMGDVMSADRGVINMVVTDPRGFPTPTLSYWGAIFDGYQHAWEWTDGARVNPETQFLILYGEHDPLLGNGGYVPKTIEWLHGIGAKDVHAIRVSGGRTAILLDERSLGVSATIAEWVDGAGAPQTLVPTTSSTLEEFTRGTLASLGGTLNDGPLDNEDLVRLCYEAIDDDALWVQLFNQLIVKLAADRSFDQTQLETRLKQLMPHWERAFSINRQLRDQAALGVILQSLMERLFIGTALLDRECAVLYHNDAFAQSYRELWGQNLKAEAGERSHTIDVSSDFKTLVANDTQEGVLLHGDRSVGYFFRPESLQISKPREGQACGLLVLRGQSDGHTETVGTRLTMLELAYGMTKQEAVVASDIADGLSPTEISKRRDVAISTVRTHLKRGFEKMEVDGQTGMVSAILSGPIGWLA